MIKGRHEPVYRVILRDAFAFAWDHKHLWPVAMVAGILLSGSIFDVIWRGMNALTTQGSITGFIFPFWQKSVETWSHLSLGSIIIGSLNVLLLTAFFLMIGYAIFSLSVIAQPTLVYAIGSRKQGKIASFREAVTVGARAFWPMLALNILSLAVLIATRSLISIALAFLIERASALTFFLYLIAFILFIVVGIAIVIIQLLAINAIILQGATIAQGLERGCIMLKRHWVVFTEAAAMLFLISAGAYIAIVALGMILSIPYVILLAISAAIHSSLLFAAISAIFILALLAIVLTVFGFVVLVHYATWTFLFRRLGEGGVIPKLHRLAHTFIHRH